MIISGLLSLLPLSSLAGLETNIPLAIYVTTNAAPWNPPRDPDAFKLAEFPILTDADFASYDWATHTITLQSNSVTKLPQFPSGGLRIIFVVVAYGQRCYVGQFRALEDAAPYPTDIPTIRVWTDQRLRNKTTRVTIEARIGSMDGRSDPRADSRVRDALRKTAKLADRQE